LKIFTMARLVRTLAVAFAVLGVVHGRAVVDERGVDVATVTTFDKDVQFVDESNVDSAHLALVPGKNIVKRVVVRSDATVTTTLDSAVQFIDEADVDSAHLALVPGKNIKRAPQDSDLDKRAVIHSDVTFENANSKLVNIDSSNLESAHLALVPGKNIVSRSLVKRDSGSHLGAIVGGIVGGLIAWVALVSILYFGWRRVVNPLPPPKHVDEEPQGRMNVHQDVELGYIGAGRGPEEEVPSPTYERHEGVTQTPPEYVPPVRT